MTQVHIFYSGTVQGVGFRYTVRGYAADLQLKGWVRNLPDGRVEILAEGPKADIDRLIESVDRHFDGYVKDKDVEYKETDGEFKDFQISL